MRYKPAAQQWMRNSTGHSDQAGWGKTKTGKKNNTRKSLLCLLNSPNSDAVLANISLLLLLEFVAIVSTVGHYSLCIAPKKHWMTRQYPNNKLSCRWTGTRVLFPSHPAPLVLVHWVPESPGYNPPPALELLSIHCTRNGIFSESSRSQK